MIKHALVTTLAAVALSSSALAAQWSVTEASTTGIKTSQGTWTLTTDGGKVAGKADMQNDKGSMLTYKLEGEAAGDTFTIKLVDRSDDKKNCVWTGKQGKSTVGHGVFYEGDVACDGSKFAIRAGVN